MHPIVLGHQCHVGIAQHSNINCFQVDHQRSGCTTRSSIISQGCKPIHCAACADAERYSVTRCSSGGKLQRCPKSAPTAVQVRASAGGAGKATQLVPGCFCNTLSDPDLSSITPCFGLSQLLRAHSGCSLQAGRQAAFVQCLRRPLLGEEEPGGIFPHSRPVRKGPVSRAKPLKGARKQHLAHLTGRNGSVQHKKQARSARGVRSTPKA